jgi:hypothetical protein
MLFALGHIHERRQITIRIEAQMQFDRPLVLRKLVQGNIERLSFIVVASRR